MDEGNSKIFMVGGGFRCKIWLLGFAQFLGVGNKQGVLCFFTPNPYGLELVSVSQLHVWLFVIKDSLD